MRILRHNLKFMITISLLNLKVTYATENIQKAKTRYYRCYSQMVRKLPNADDPLLKMIESQKINGTDACMQLLELAQLDETTGQIKGATVQANKQVSVSEYERALKSTFGSTLHAHLTSNKCIQCHSGTKPTIPSHSSSKVDIAYAAIFNNNLINLDKIDNSKLYLKVKNGHQCSGEECQELAGGIKNAISMWENAFNQTYKKEKDEITIISDKLSDGGFPIIGQSILKTFNDFHRGWMGTQEKFELQEACVSETHDIFDSGVHALYATQSLFTNKPFNNVITSKTPIKAIRYSTRPRSNRSVVNGRIKMNFLWGHPRTEDGRVNYKTGTLPDHWSPPELVELGHLIGITEREQSTMPRDYLSLTTDLNLFQTDAGAINTPSYMILNNGIGRQRSNGGLAIQRRWSRAVLNDFLCRDIPVIRTKDAIAYLDNEGKSSMPFRKGISCMKCHASMDQMAKVARSTQVILAYSYKCGGNTTSLLVHRHPATLEQHINDNEGWVDENDKNYYKTPNFGRFYFRTYDGKLINKSIDGFDGLAQAISETDDYYICAAKRYLNFFTGIDIPMFDVGDLNAPYLNEKEKEYRNFVIELGKDLKGHQDLKQTIRRIIASEAFLTPGKKVK